MQRFAYVNERTEESVVLIQPFAHSARVAPGGRIDVLFEAQGVANPEILVTHRADGAVEIALRVNLISISGDGVDLGPKPAAGTR